MAKKRRRNRKRTSYMEYSADIELEISPVTLWAYDKAGDFVCRVEINRAGLALHAGTKGKKRIADLTWEKLVQRLQKPE